MTHTNKDYSQWGDHHRRHGTAEDFHTALTETPAAGVHTIGARDDEALDLLITGEPGQDGRAIPVFFNGAVPGRHEKTGPFFSGGRVGPKVSSGYISVSDPAVDRDPEQRSSGRCGGGFLGSLAQDRIIATKNPGVAKLIVRSARRAPSTPLNELLGIRQ